MTATPNAIDVLVGGNIRFWRLRRGMTVHYVASTLGVTAGAFGSMEVGMTRIGAKALHQLCGLLQIRPAQVYDDCGLFQAR